MNCSRGTLITSKKIQGLTPLAQTFLRIHTFQFFLFRLQVRSFTRKFFTVHTFLFQLQVTSFPKRITRKKNYEKSPNRLLFLLSPSGLELKEQSKFGQTICLHVQFSINMCYVEAWEKIQKPLDFSQNLLEMRIIYLDLLIDPINHHLWVPKYL